MIPTRAKRWIEPLHPTDFRERNPRRVFMLTLPGSYPGSYEERPWCGPTLWAPPSPPRGLVLRPEDQEDAVVARARKRAGLE